MGGIVFPCAFVTQHIVISVPLSADTRARTCFVHFTAITLNGLGTLASGGSPMFPLVVNQPASLSIWPAVQSLRRGMSTNPGVTMWCVCGCS